MTIDVPNPGTPSIFGAEVACPLSAASEKRPERLHDEVESESKKHKPEGAAVVAVVPGATGSHDSDIARAVLAAAKASEAATAAANAAAILSAQLQRVDAERLEALAKVAVLEASAAHQVSSAQSPGSHSLGARPSPPPGIVVDPPSLATTKATIPVEIREAIIKESKKLSRDMFSFLRTKDAVQAGIKDLEIYDQPNCAYPKNVKAFTAQSEFIELENPVSDVDSDLRRSGLGKIGQADPFVFSVEIPRGHKKKEAMKLVHHAAARFYKAMDHEAMVEKETTLQIKVMYDGFLTRCKTFQPTQPSVAAPLDNLGDSVAAVTVNEEALGKWCHTIFQKVKLKVSSQKKHTDDIRETARKAEAELQKKVSFEEPQVYLSQLVKSEVQSEVARAKHAGFDTDGEVESLSISDLDDGDEEAIQDMQGCGDAGDETPVESAFVQSELAGQFVRSLQAQQPKSRRFSKKELAERKVRSPLQPGLQGRSGNGPTPGVGQGQNQEKGHKGGRDLSKGKGKGKDGKGKGASKGGSKGKNKGKGSGKQGQGGNGAWGAPQWHHQGSAEGSSGGGKGEQSGNNTGGRRRKH